MKYTLEIVETTDFISVDDIPQMLNITYTTEAGYVGKLKVRKEGMTKEKIIKLVEEDIKQVGSLHKATLGA